MTAQYRLLQPHYVLNAFIDAGTTVTEGVQIPVGWPPTLNVDPLNSDALTAFYNQGPRGLGWGQFNNFGQENYISYSVLPVQSPTSSPPVLPVTYWVQSSPGFYKLTGLGVLLAPVPGP